MIFSARPLLTAALALCGFTAFSADAQTVQVIGQGTLSAPYGVAVDKSGNLFVANTGDSKIDEFTASGSYASATVILPSANFDYPYGVTLDSSGNLFVADTYNYLIEEITAKSNYTSGTVLAAAANGDLLLPTSVVVDSAGNVFVAEPDLYSIYEIPAAGGYANFKVLPAANEAFDVGGIAIDSANNLYVTDYGNNAVKEIPAAGGYDTIKTLATGFNEPLGVAVDSSGNVYVADTVNNAVKEILASSGAVVTLAADTGNFKTPAAVAVDSAGNVFVADAGNNVVKKIVAASPLAASVLPGGRSVETGTAATVFASLLNTGSTALSGCGVTLPSTAPSGLSLSFQTTDPSTNDVTGTPNQTVDIAAGGAQTFVLTFQSSADVSAPGLAPVFACTDTTAAPVTTGVDTVDLTFSSTPIADVIALAATATDDGTVHIANGNGAFAVATINDGAAADLTAEVDFGSATPPAAAELCQTDASGACQGTAAASVPVSIAAGGTPTFSVFVGASSSIAFDPSTTRVFVRFVDSSGVSHGSTSVALTTD